MRLARRSLLLLALLALVGASRPARAQFAPVTWITRDTLARDWWPRVAPDGRTITFSRSRDGGATYEMMRTTIAGDPSRPFFAKPPAGLLGASSRQQTGVRIGDASCSGAAWPPRAAG